MKTNHSEVSLSESSYNEIKKRIQDNTYPPNMKLVIQDLSDSLGVSRTPIVSALNRLLAEGLIESLPQKGLVVKALSIREIQNVLELRIMIEMYAIRPAVKNVVFCGHVLQEMREIAEEFQDVEDNDYDRICEIESRFHHRYISLIGNSEILQVYKSKRCVELTYYMYKMANLPLTNLKKTFEEHSKIVDYLDNRDVEGLEALLNKHINSPMEALEWLIKNNIFQSNVL